MPRGGMDAASAALIAPWHLPHADLHFCAGDHVAVFAENSSTVVEAAAKLLGLPLSHCFRLVQPPGNPHCLPEPFHGE